MAKSERLRAILADDDFLGVIKGLEAQLTRKVMATGADEQAHRDALNTYRGLQAAMAALRSAAENKDST